MVNNKIITDREEVSEAIKNGGYYLEDADDTLKADREVVLEAVKNFGQALECNIRSTAWGGCRHKIMSHQMQSKKQRASKHL